MSDVPDMMPQPVPGSDTSPFSTALLEPARPYGLIGLTISTLAILLTAGVVCVLIATAAFAVGAAIFGFHGALDRIAHFDPSDGQDPGFVRLNIVVGLIAYVVVSLVILAAARVRGHGRWRDLVGWRAWHPFHGAAPFWALLALTLVYSMGADRLVTHIYPQAQDWTPTPTGAIWDLLFVGLASVLAPIAEELLFRGWLYTGLRLSIGIPAAMIVTSALFALAHWENTHLYALAIFPVGLALAHVREKTDSIAASIGFHALYNGFASAALLFPK